MPGLFLQKYLAITDLETTGLDFDAQEIIEIGALLVEQKNMEALATFEVKVAPTHLETANPESLVVAGFRPEDWQGAIPLKEALEQYVTFLNGKEAVFTAWNPTFDWAFMQLAFKKTGVKNPFDYHHYDIWTASAELLKNKTDVAKLKLSYLNKYFGTPPDPLPHRALNGANAAYELLKKLRGL